MAELTLFLAGDVMTGRGIDQVLPSPGDPALREELVRDARRYVALAEAANGPIPQPVDVSWPWGDVLTVLNEAEPDVRIFNVETSVTRSGDFAPGKRVHYRMHPDNAGCLVVALPEVEDVVVGEHAHVGPSRHQAASVVRMHPVVHPLPRREVA